MMKLIMLLVLLVAGCAERPSSVAVENLDGIQALRYADLYHDPLPKGKSAILLRLPFKGIPLYEHYTVTVTVNGTIPAACVGAAPCFH